MEHDHRTEHWQTGDGRFYSPGLTRSQFSNLEMRARAERVIRQAMSDGGASQEEVEHFLAASLPPIWAVVAANTPRLPLDVDFPKRCDFLDR
jgi:hypothetical protein